MFGWKFKMQKRDADYLDQLITDRTEILLVPTIDGQRFEDLKSRIENQIKKEITEIFTAWAKAHNEEVNKSIGTWLAKFEEDYQSLQADRKKSQAAMARHAHQIETYLHGFNVMLNTLIDLNIPGLKKKKK